ncbi:MAG: hypothetical protein Tsb0020_27460 [Haliangiales bacterium]
MQLSLSNDEQARLVKLLEKCNKLSDPKRKLMLVDRLPSELRPYVSMSSGLRVFLSGLVRTCARFEGGIAALCAAVRWLEGDSYAMRAVEDMVRETGVDSEQLDPHHDGPATFIAHFDMTVVNRKLVDAEERRAALVAVGASTTAVDREILALKRRKRRGSHLSAGHILDERYLLQEPLGHGGYGVVWSAHDNHNDQVVAVKVLHSHIAEATALRDRFFRGARIMSELDHPAIVNIRVAKAEDYGFHFFVMDLLSGGDLRAAIAAGALDDDQVPGRRHGRLIDILLEVGDALRLAHSKGYIHRDIKPSNILLDHTGAPHLTDFDLVGASDTTGGTATGDRFGTFFFAAPELMRDATQADARTDVFALGMTAVAAIYGRELPIEIFVERAPFLANLRCDSGLREIVTRAVDMRPENRYPDMASFCQALARLRAGPDEEAGAAARPEPPSAIPTMRPQARKTERIEVPTRGLNWRSREASIAAALTLVAIAVITALVTVYHGGEPSTTVGKPLAPRPGGGAAERQHTANAEVTAPTALGEGAPVTADAEGHAASEARAGDGRPAMSDTVVISDVALSELPGMAMVFVTIDAGVASADDDAGAAARSQAAASQAGYQLAMHPVSRAQWRAVTSSDSCPTPCAPEVPMQRLTAADAAKFLNRLTERESRLRGVQLDPCYQFDSGHLVAKSPCTGYRLPSRREWADALGSSRDQRWRLYPLNPAHTSWCWDHRSARARGCRDDADDTTRRGLRVARDVTR